MRFETDFVVRYDVEAPVPISDVIDSLRSVDTLLRETAALLPSILPGLTIEHIEIRVRSVVQESPLREAFAAALLVAYQDDLTREIPPLVGAMLGHDVPANLSTTVTVVTLIIAFYGVDAVRRVLTGGDDNGPSKRKLDALIKELSQMTGASEKVINDRLEERYGQKGAWKRITEAAAKFFRPSKRQGDAAVEVNDRKIGKDVVADIPQEYLVKEAEDRGVFRSFPNVPIELHAQDRDHSGQGWAAHIPGVTLKRVRLKLMPGISAADLWGRNTAHGDVTVFYNRVGPDMVPKAITLDRLTG